MIFKYENERFAVTSCMNEAKYIRDSWPGPGTVHFMLQHTCAGCPYLAIVAAVDIHPLMEISANYNFDAKPRYVPKP